MISQENARKSFKPVLEEIENEGGQTCDGQSDGDLEDQHHLLLNDSEIRNFTRTPISDNNDTIYKSEKPLNMKDCVTKKLIAKDLEKNAAVASIL